MGNENNGSQALAQIPVAPIAQAEIGASALSMRAEADVQARWLVAQRRPRDMDTVRVNLLRECKRPGFADAAWYFKPIGKGVEGFSIRFAEAALRIMGNLSAMTPCVHDDEHKRIFEVTVTDLETNATLSTQVVVEKTVERRTLKKGQIAIRERINSEGQPAYTVAATDDEILNKQNALISKSLRTNLLRVLPGDIQDECKTLILRTRDDAAAKDPDAKRKEIADAFASLGVLPSQLKEYLGHDLSQSSPSQLAQMRAAYVAIKDGEATWADMMEFKKGEQADPKSGSAMTDRIKERRAAKQSAANAPDASAPPAAPETPTPDEVAEIEAHERDSGEEG